MFSSPLRRAISRGMKPDGDLSDELLKLDDYQIRSRKDAKAICDALDAISVSSMRHSDFSSPLRSLTTLFQDVAGPDTSAFEVLHEEGLPILIRIFENKYPHNNEEDTDDLLFILKILAMYGTREGAELIVKVATDGFEVEEYLWHIILSIFSEGHPERDFVYQALSEKLPTGFLAVALLDSANAAALEGDLEHHPFDSADGKAQLEKWLLEKDPELSSYAHSTTAALPFISNPERDQLLALAMDHIDTNVQMEAAWAAGKLGREAGLKCLARFCLDVNHSEIAQRYLAELEQEDLIPESIKDSRFLAKAEFANWLAHPNELGRPPDELEIVDHRELNWPADFSSRPMFIIKYTLRDTTDLEEDDVDCGLVGSMTWCFFSYRMHQRPPEDVYAIHCAWEMENADLISVADVAGDEDYDHFLAQWQGPPLATPTITRIAEISPKLKTPASVVILATAKCEGEDGWVVLDGPRSTWYPRNEQPEKTYETVVLKIHLGRQILGFENQPDRKQYLVTETKERSPEQFISAYEKLLDQVPTAGSKAQENLLGSQSDLGEHFAQYVQFRAEVDSANISEITITLYEKFLSLVRDTDRKLHEDLYDSFGVLGDNFERYVDALVAVKREKDIPKIITLFETYWDHNLGYGKLGRAAYKARNEEAATYYFEKLLNGMHDYQRAEEMSLLAELRYGRGDENGAEALLANCMKRLAKDIYESDYNSDKKMFAEEYASHRATFLKLFSDGESRLEALKIPEKP